jgi:hypothetical protein
MRSMWPCNKEILDEVHELKPPNFIQSLSGGALE